jgi:hypothetical protein
MDIDGNNVHEFENIIKQMPAFVKIFSPSCGHCIAMAEEWKNLNKNEKVQGYNVAIVSINADAIDKMNSPGLKSFSGVPTIREIKQGTGEAGKEYAGKRLTGDMADFITSVFNKDINKDIVRKKIKRVTKHGIKHGITKKHIKKRLVHRRGNCSRKCIKYTRKCNRKV